LHKCTFELTALQTLHGKRVSVPLYRYTVQAWIAPGDPFSGNIMRPSTKTTAHTADQASEFALSRQAQAQALGEADRARAEQRSESDARIDSNASKWRYSGTAERA
jgi:hypothetical protein